MKFLREIPSRVIHVEKRAIVARVPLAGSGHTRTMALGSVRLGKPRVIAICAFVVLLVGVPLVAPTAPARADSHHLGSWESIAPMLKGRSSFGATTGPCPAPPKGPGVGRCIYAVGAFTLADGNLMAEFYDPSAPTLGWRDLPQMAAPLGRSGVSAATGADGRIYAFGINLYDMVSVEAYNPRTNLWEPVPPPVFSPRNGMAAVADAEGRIYALGGGYPSATANVEVYD
ncbi:MAG TPA: hypothetical protein VM324_00055, partial [Egibacteraceae bacterium]|nr:hypothetical protein [Egibacteraceae bacterium]